MIKAIIFDCGGVLLKKERNRDLVTILANVINQSSDFIKPLWEKHHDNLLTGNLTSKEFIGVLADELNYQYNVNEIYSKWAEKISITKSSINHNLINYIKTLRQRYKIYVLSNMIDLAEEDRALKLFRKNFDGYFTSYQFGSRKPQPEIFRKLLTQINLKPDECIFVDDNKKNIIASVSLGFHSIQYESARKLKKLRRDFFPIGHRVGEWLRSVENQEGIPDESDSGRRVAYAQIPLGTDFSGSVQLGVGSYRTVDYQLLVGLGSQMSVLLKM